MTSKALLCIPAARGQRQLLRVRCTGPCWRRPNQNSAPPESSSPTASSPVPCFLAASSEALIISSLFAILQFCFHHILLTLSVTRLLSPPPHLVCMWLVYVWSAQRAPGHVPSAAAGAERPHTPSEAFALSLLALVLLYFSSVVLFSFSTLPLYSEDRLEVARMQGLGEPTALHKFGSCHSINCLDSKS